MSKRFTTFMRTERGLAPILIILILAALIGGYLVYKTFLLCPPGSGRFYWGDQCHGTGVLLKPSPSPTVASPAPTDTIDTANWKTYSNSKYHFSLKYPETWLKKDENVEKSELVIPIKPNCTNFCDNGGPLTISVLNNSGNLSIKDLAQHEINPDTFTDQFIDSEKDLVQSFKQVHPSIPIFGIMWPGECGGDAFFIQEHNNVIELSFSCMNYFVPAIMSTFKLSQ